MMGIFGIASGTARQNMQKRCKEFGVDTSHFTPNSHIFTKNLASIIGKKKEAKDVFASTRARGSQLKRALFESGVEYICQLCGQEPTWNRKDLTLQVDHIDGNKENNSKENLRFLCPNCHTQTDTWGFKDGAKVR